MQYFNGLFYQKTPSASITDLTSPTFSGPDAITALANGSIRIEWSAASDATNPIRYEVYVQANTATGLYNLSNISYVSYGTEVDIYQLSDNSRLVKNVQYYVGVRAVDAVGNRETNTSSLSATSTGVLSDDLATIAASLAATQVLLDNDHTNFVNVHNNLYNDHLDFQADHANFVSDHNNFVNDHNNLNADHVNLDTSIGNLNTSISDLADTVVLLENVEADLQTDHTNLAASVTDLENANIALSNIEADLATDVDKVETAANLLITTVL